MKNNNAPATGSAVALPASPAAIDASESRQRFSFTLLVAAAGCIAFGFMLGVIGRQWWPFAVIDIAFGVPLLMLRHWVLSAPDASRLRIGVHLLALLTILLLFWHIYFAGLGHSFAVWFFILIPVAVALLGSARTVFGWTAVSLLAIVVAHVIARISPVAPLLVLSPDLLIFAQLLLVTVAALYSVAALRANASHLQRLHESWATLLAQNSLLDQQALAINNSLREAEAARAAADASSRAKSEFLAMMSHEIRTPLNGVIGLNSLLLDLPLDEKARHYAELSQQSGESLLALINDFLDFSRMESGHLELEEVPFDPRRVIVDTIAIMQESARSKGLTLSSDIDAPALLNGDPTRLRQILLNLVGNAVKFTPRGEVRLSCRVLPSRDEHIWLCIDVRDTGIGIDADTIKKLFQPFTQADASTTRRYGGTGLGLAICRALSERMGGNIGVDSSSGVGSTFRVELPFTSPLKPALNAGMIPAIRSSESADSARQFRGHVLVAEDNQVNQFVAREMLERLGLTVDTANDGEQAIHCVGARDYDVVFMDCDMPVVDGFAATRSIRALDGPCREVLIVAMTAGVLAGDEEKCRAAGMNDYIAKPVRFTDLEQLLARWLDRVGP